MKLLKELQTLLTVEDIRIKRNALSHTKALQRSYTLQQQRQQQTVNYKSYQDKLQSAQKI